MTQRVQKMDQGAQQGFWTRGQTGFGAVPLLCAAEIAVPGSMPLCIRVLLHVSTARSREDMHHVYLHGASGLRDDLPD